MADVGRPARPHPTHDLALIAAAAADDLTGAAVREAAELVAACAECAALHADLVAIAAATRALPDPVRPRSFTISAEQAARLRPSGWRRLTAVRIADYRIARPMAVACTTLGLAGLLLATLSSGPLGALSLGGAAAAPAGTETAQERDTRSSMGFVASPSAVDGAAASPLVPAGLPQPSGDTSIGSSGNVPPAGPSDGATAPLTAEARAVGPSALAIASVVLLVVGVTMLGLVVIAARRHPGPDDRA